MIGAKIPKNEGECGHTVHNGTTFVCDQDDGHRGLHYDSEWRTNWGDDGKAIHATRDTKRLRESGRAQ